VQAYAALAFLALAVLLWVWLPLERRRGDVAGLGLLGAGVAIYLTEIWRDWTGREMFGPGSLLRGFIDGPQIAAVLLVLAGAFMLRETRNDLHENKNAFGESTLQERKAAPNHEEQPAQATGNRGAA
jgi:phosphatidylglycerol:prolipoprotein diacylglycerol transferase